MEKRRILLIDDEVLFTDVMKMYLEKTGRYDVRVEHDGQRGISAVRVFQPDAILLDVVMPHMDGGHVAEVLRTDPQLKHIPVIFLTAIVSREEVSAEVGLIGGQLFIAKPVSAKEVLSYIDRHIGEGSRAAATIPNG